MLHGSPAQIRPAVVAASPPAASDPVQSQCSPSHWMSRPSQVMQHSMEGLQISPLPPLSSTSSHLLPLNPLDQGFLKPTAPASKTMENNLASVTPQPQNACPIQSPRPQGAFTRRFLFKKKHRRSSIASLQQPQPETPSKRSLQSLPFFSSPFAFAAHDTLSAKKHKAQHDDMSAETPSKRSSTPHHPSSFGSSPKRSPLSSFYFGHSPRLQPPTNPPLTPRRPLRGATPLKGYCPSPLRSLRQHSSSRMPLQHQQQQEEEEEEKDLLEAASMSVEVPSSLLELLQQSLKENDPPPSASPSLFGSNAVCFSSDFQDGLTRPSSDTACSRPSLPSSMLWNMPYLHFLTADYFLTADDALVPKPSLSGAAGQQNYFDQAFLMIGRIGNGAFAEAFQVQHLETGRVFAIKRTKHVFQGYKDRLKKLEEVQVLLKLGHHPNCIHFVTAWEQAGHLYIQTDFYENGSLQLLMESRCHEPFTLQELWKATFELASGLAHIHTQGLAHLDLKPSNVFIDGQGVLKIGDFGMAIELDKERTDEREGDRNYMAPEILEGRYGQPADLFSLGLTLLEMTASVDLPEAGEPYHRLRQGDLSGVPLDDSHASPELLALIQQMMAPVPADRPTALHAMEQAQCEWKRQVLVEEVKPTV